MEGRRDEAYKSLNNFVDALSWQSLNFKTFGNSPPPSRIIQDNALGGIFNGGKADYADGKPHTFGIAWDRAGIRWFVDGQQYKTINYAELPTSQQALLRQAFASGTKFAPIINLAVGGKFDGRYTDASGAAIAAAKTRFPASLTLSDVQAWTV